MGADLQHSCQRPRHCNLGRLENRSPSGKVSPPTHRPKLDRQQFRAQVHFAQQSMQTALQGIDLTSGMQLKLGVC